MMCTV